MEGADFHLEENDIIRNLRKCYDFKIQQVVEECNEGLFADLYLFSVGGLDTYYSVFKESAKFQDL